MRNIFIKTNHNISLNDQLIIEQIKNQNVKVFEAVFKEYFKPLSIYANKYVCDLDIAQDVVQEVFVKLYEKKDDLVIHTSLKAFLYASVKNRCLDYLRSNKIRQKHKEAIQNESDTFIQEDDNDAIEQTELQEKIYKAIQSLPDQNRKIFILSRFEGKTNQEIAEELNISKRTVETHISNALKKIKSLVLLGLIVLIISFFNFF